jgi:hypothetical protein
MKPWANHAVAVVAAALAICGRASAPTATRLAEPRNTDLRLSFLIALSSLCALARVPATLFEIAADGLAQHSWQSNRPAI